jgi:hypothetical protein
LAEAPPALRRAQILGRRGGADRQARAQAWRPEHARWVFDYDRSSTDDDEAGYRFGVHSFAPGEYVSIRDEDGELHTFKVVSVEPAA